MLFGVLWYGGRLVIAGEISLGVLIAFLMVTGMLYPRITSIFNNILAFQGVKIEFERFMEYYDVKKAVEEYTTTEKLSITSGKIEIENLNFGYTQDNMILKDLSLTIEPNKVTVIVGNNGCGKTTLCKLISRFFDPNDGRIMIDGTDIRYISLISLRESISYQPQNQFLISGTILENITCGKDTQDVSSVLTAVKTAKIAAFIDDLPYGLYTRIGEGGSRISGGQAQRIALARLYYNNVPIILLDEPTTFIDTEGEGFFKEIIEELRYKATIIVVTHNRETVKLADTVIDLKMEDN